MVFSTRRNFIELPVNLTNEEYAKPDSIFGINNRRWHEALIKLGLVVQTDFPAISTYGERLPAIKSRLYDTELHTAGQFGNLAMVSRGNQDGLGVHMTSSLRRHWDEQSPIIKPDLQPRELTVENILSDIACVTIGKEERQPDITPEDFIPMIAVCRDLGTISLLEQTQ